MSDDIEILLSALNHMDAAVAVTDAEGIFQWVNPAFTALTGYTLEEANGQTPRLLKSGHHEQEYYSRMWSALRSGKPWKGEFINRRKDGSHYVEEQCITPVLDSTGAVRRFVTVKRDVTSGNSRRGALVRSAGKDGACHFFNGEWLQFRGRVLHEEHGGGWMAGVHPEDRAGLTEALDCAFMRRASLQVRYRLLRHDGEYRQILDSGNPLFDCEGVFSGYLHECEDITARESMEGSYLRNMLDIWEHSSDGMRLTDAGGAVLLVNDAYCQMVSLDRGQIEGQLYTVVYGGEDRDRALAAYRNRVQRGEIQTRFERQLTLWNGEKRFLDVSAATIQSAEGVRVLTIFRDATERKLAERRIQELTERLVLATHSASIGVFDHDFATGLSVWNDGMHELFGIEPDVFEGTFEEFISRVHPEDREMIPRHVETARRTGSSGQIEFRIFTPRGMRIVEAQAICQFDEEGRPAHLVGMNRDITEQRSAAGALRESEERYRSVIAAMAEGVLLLDAAGIILTCNSAAERILDRRSQDMIGRRISELGIEIIREDGSPRTPEEYPSRITILSGKPTLGIVIGLRRNTGTTWISINCEPVFREGGAVPYAVVSSFTDITARKLAEEKAERDSREMEILVGKLAEEKERAEAATRIKSEFLSSMSHEIRTPMNGIMGMTRLLLDSPLGAEQEAYAQAIRHSSDALLTIVNDILDFSKMEAGKLELEDLPFDLQSAAEDVLDLLRVKAHEKDLDLALWYGPEAPRQFMGDCGRVRQILVNLVGNAIKFTERGHVQVRINCVEAGNGAARMAVEVEDTGIGIPAQKLPQLFTMFTQGDASTTRKYGGTGLGLAISRRLAGLMGGTLTAGSRYGKGSTFRLELRLAQAPCEAGADGVLSGKRVLIACTRANTRTSLVNLCGQWGMETDSAEEPQAAQRLCKPGFHDVILWDASWPAPRTEAPLLWISSKGAAADGRYPRLSPPVRASLLRKALLSQLGAPGSGYSVGPAEGSDRPSERSGEAPFHGSRVLVVEDNSINRAVAKALLAKFGCSVSLACNGAEAITMAAGTSFDLIYMDCQMPELDGYQATAAIRSPDSANARTPIVALTASVLQTDRERCLAAGMDDHVSKPISPETLFASLEKWLAK
ncbi:MAG: PAS domain S-box protein [Bryobacterales bacterium]|nr:PAS domain S-box protein [Bryobacterales bacterium]